MTKFDKVKLGLGLAAAIGVGLVGADVSHSVRQNMPGGKIVKFLGWLGLLGLTAAAGTVSAKTLMDTTDGVKDIYDKSKENSKK
jgi:hypothetical protein